MGRFKDSFLKDKKFWKETFIILLVGIIINVACFLMPLVVHAETPVNYYPVTSGQNNMQVLSLEQIFYQCNSIAGYDFSNVNYVIFIDDNSSSSYPNARKYNILVWDKNLNENPFYIELDYGGTFFEFHVVSQTSSTFSYRIYSFQDVFGDLTLVNDSSVYYSERLGYLNGDSPLYRSNCDYVFNTSIYLNQPDNLISPVLQYIENGINIGDFVDLPGLDEILDDLNNQYENPSGLTGHALPSQPTENPNNNDFQNRLQMFDYLKDTLTALFGNLGYNISNWLNSLGSKIVQGFNSVSQNIWNGFKTLMDNIKDFFAPKLDYIIDRLNYITEPLDQEEINDFIESSDVYSDVSSIQTSVSTFTGSLTGVSEPSSYSITLHIEDIGILHQEQPYVLSFDILNDVKVYIRGFLWCFCTYGLFISVVDSIANYINGGGGEDD